MPPEEGGVGFSSARGVRSRISWALRSHWGMVRSDNQDFVGVYAPAAHSGHSPLFVIADGMGGHAAGGVASRLAVETMIEAWLTNPTEPVSQALKNAVRSANADVFGESFEPDQHGMGTTLTALTISLTTGLAYIAHIGDSRAYLVRDRYCSQLTSDHSRVAEMVRAKLLSPAEAAEHPGRSMLTRNLGATPGVNVDVTQTELRVGDVIILCSDGLWDTVTAEELAETAGAPGPDVSAGMLLDTALARGATDNVSVIVVRITSSLNLPPAELTKSSRSRRARFGKAVKKLLYTGVRISRRTRKE